MIDVIIPTYIPSEKYLDFFSKAIESLQAQTYSHFLAHIIYNGPATYEVDIRKLSTDLRFKVHNIGNKASGAIARNYGIINSSQKYIAQLDIDDMYDKNKLLKQYEFMEINEWCDICCTSSKVMIDDNKFVKSCINPLDYDNNDKILNRLNIENIICHGSAMIKRSSIMNKKLLYNEKNKPGTYWNDYNSIMYEDWDLWQRCAKADLKFHIIPEELYFWRQGSSVER